MTFQHVTRHVALGLAAVLIAASPARAADDSGSVQGVVNDASGKPVAGAFVKLKNPDRRLTFMVISQDQGRFEAKDLPPGAYKVQGVGAGLESDWLANVSVTAGQSAKVDVSLTNKRSSYVWVSHHQVDMIARFDPRTEEWVEFPLPEAKSDPRRIDIDPTNPDRVYFSGNTPGRIGFVEVLRQ